MSIATVLRSQPLLDSNKRVFAYFVPAEELERLLSQIEQLQSDLARAHSQRDRMAKDFQEVLMTFAPPEPTPEEWGAFQANPEAMASLIAQLEAR